MKTFKTRQQLYLPDDLVETLGQLARKPGSSKTAIMTEALRFWIEHRGRAAIDEQLSGRLDRLSRGQEHILDRVNTLADALGLSVLHQLTLVAHQPPFDAEAQRLGRLRYEAFIERVGRMRAGRASARPLGDSNDGV